MDLSDLIKKVNSDIDNSIPTVQLATDLAHSIIKDFSEEEPFNPYNYASLLVKCLDKVNDLPSFGEYNLEVRHIVKGEIITALAIAALAMKGSNT